MKPRNFPGRKNQRRAEALERMVWANKTNVIKDEGSIWDNTFKKIIDQKEAEVIRTKKNRMSN